MSDRYDGPGPTLDEPVNPIKEIDRLTKQRDELLAALQWVLHSGEKIKKLAFELEPPNHIAPQLVQAAIEMEQAARAAIAKAESN